MDSSLRWVLALVSVVLGIAALMFGQSLLPPFDVMRSKLGTAVPLYLTWGMIGVAIVIAFALAGFLVATGLGMVRDAE